MLPDLHTDFSRGRSGGLVFPSLSEFSTVCCNLHSQRLGIVNKAEIDVYLELSHFFYDTMDVGNLISGSSAFFKTSWTYGSLLFTYYWSLAWRILSITLLACEMSAIYGSYFCIHSASLCLLVGTFNPFTFKVIIDIYVPIAIFSIVWGWFCRSFFLSWLYKLV